MDYEKQIFTVTQLNLFIKDLFAQVPLFGSIKIKGEISNFKHHSSGHMYMSLKDETGVIRAVMFRTAAMTLDFRPENGMQVVAEGRVSVYERDGQYQLYINKMTKDGKGNLYEQFEKLKAKLQAEGLFDYSAKKPIPDFPKRIGVVTAPTGAAVRDIINIITRRFSFCNICLYPTLVQGSGAAESIAEAIEYFNQTKSADVLIVGRGGGSIEDLWAFNEEIVARAIFASEIPVISAVGHETDFTIADFVADLRAPTPSAAAELAVPSELELADKFQSYEVRLKTASKKILENRRLLLKMYSEKQVMRDPVSKVSEKGIYLDHLTKMFENAANAVFAKKQQEIGGLASKLDGLSPLGTLNRGYSVAKNSKGEVIRSVEQVRSGDSMTVRVSDGEINTIVK
ncbi:MAG: exodeoxyribonuclease VII large subunit [Ruminococcaceae bacterium]|nr:exodeoxyribonuclease VII large subunit [Oscillospiraceae bacterium]